MHSKHTQIRKSSGEWRKIRDWQFGQVSPIISITSIICQSLPMSVDNLVIIQHWSQLMAGRWWRGWGTSGDSTKYLKKVSFKAAFTFTSYWIATISKQQLVQILLVFHCMIATISGQLSRSTKQSPNRRTITPLHQLYSSRSLLPPQLHLRCTIIYWLQCCQRYQIRWEILFRTMFTKWLCSQIGLRCVRHSFNQSLILRLKETFVFLWICQLKSLRFWI